MATTSTNPMAGKRIGGKAGRFSLKTKLATGGAILACVAAVALGGLLRANDAARDRSAVPAASQAPVNPYWVYQEDADLYYVPTYRDEPRTAPPANASVSDEFRWDFPPSAPGFYPDQFTYKEDHRAPAAVLSAEEQRFLEQNTQLPGAVPPAAPVSAERQQFMAWNMELPSGGVTGQFYPDQFTFREDRREGNPAPPSAAGTIDFGPVECGVVPCVSTSALDPEQEERTQVAPGPSIGLTGETPCIVGGTIPCGVAGMVSPAETPTSADITGREDRRDY